MASEQRRACRSCRQPYTRPAGSDDPLCPACREQVATWHSPERLSALAQQGFEESMGMRPPSGLYADLPPDAGLRAQPWQQGSGMAPQQMLGWSDTAGAWISEDRWDPATGEDVMLPGQARCRHCAVPLTQGLDGTWADASGFATCFSEDVLHEPLPAGLDGSPA
jgi:hypothetical protein